MADIFLSYSRDDQATARRFADAFKREGFDVWWDQTLDPGDAYDHVTEKALEDASAVVVLWSRRSVESRWVRAEATQADRSKTMVPVTIESCKRPIMFELTQTTDLSHWTGETSDPGWRSFVDGLRRFVERSRTVKAARPAGMAAGSSSAPAPSRESGGPSQARKWVAAAFGLLVVVGAIAFLLYRKPDPAPSPEAVASAAVASTKPRIAILPFGNLSPDPVNAFFADGMHEEVLSALSNSAPGLEVISRTTMMTYRTAPKPVAEIARELGATYVLEGSVRREGEDVRLTLQLIDAKTDGHIWAQNFDRKLVSAMTLQSEVAAAVASQLAVQLMPAARVATTPPTKDPVAYDLYLQARLAARLVNGTTSREEVRRIRDLYGAAIARDPDFGLAYLGRVLLRPGLSGGSKDEMDAWMREFKQDVASARRILGDDPRVDLFEAINASGGWWKDPATKLALFEAAEAQGLNDPDILIMKSGLLVSTGRMDEALALEQRLVTLDPANTRALTAWTADSWLARQPQQSLRAADLLIQRLPASEAELWKGYRGALIYGFTGVNDSWEELNLPPLPSMDQDFLVATRIKSLRLRGRHTELLKLLENRPGTFAPRAVLFESYNLGFPPPPMAQVRAWANLLLDNKAAARADGQTVLKVLGQAPPESNTDLEWLARLRVAEGQLFAGDNAKAATAAREGMALVPRSQNALLWAYAATVAAGVLAWAKQEDEAATLLEQLADAVPGVAPATIARDPIYTVALKDNARFQALKAKLEAQMAATKL